MTKEFNFIRSGYLQKYVKNYIILVFWGVGFWEPFEPMLLIMVLILEIQGTACPF